MNDNFDSRGPSNTGSTLVGFALGAVVGAGLALLLAPDSGKKTRERLASTARKWSKDAGETMEHAHANGGTVPLINVVVTLIVVGVLLWLINTFIPMDGKIKNLLNIVVVVAVVIWLLNAFGLMGNIRNLRVGQ